MGFPIDSPLPLFYDRNGLPLDAGFVFIGTVGLNPETNPLPVFWDADETQPAPQPLRTIRGYIARNGAPAVVYVRTNYSVTVRDRNRQLVLNAPNSATLERTIAVLSNPADGFGVDLVANADRSFANIGELRAHPIPAPIAGRTYAATVLEYGSGANAGGGSFRWDATSAAPDNGGSVINPTGNTGAGRWERITNEVFAADYGILPDGVDHSAKMQALIDQVSADGGGVIQLTPADTQYVMRFTMKTGVCVRGVPGAFGQNFTGQRRLVEILMPNSPGDIVSYQAPGGSDPEGNTNQNTALISLVLRGRGIGTTGRGIFIQAARNAIIHDICVYDVADEAFYCDDNVRLGNFTQMGGYNCVLNRARAANIYAARLGGGDHIIADWEFNPALTALSSASKFIRAIGILGDNVRWDNIIGEFGDVGITIEGVLHHGGRSRGEFNFAEGYDIGSIGANLGTLFSSNNSTGSNGVYDGIVLRSSSAANQITQWKNQNDGRGNTRYGLRDDHAGDNDKNYLGMGFSTGDRTAPLLVASVGGALVQQNADFFTISGNSTTPTLVPFLKNYRFNNSSATTVTAFLNTFPGMEVCIRADNGNTTLQHGASFVLPGSNNLTLASGKFYVLKRLGGAFYLISVSP